MPLIALIADIWSMAATGCMSRFNPNPYLLNLLAMAPTITVLICTGVYLLALERL